MVVQCFLEVLETKVRNGKNLQKLALIIFKFWQILTVPFQYPLEVLMLATTIESISSASLISLWISAVKPLSGWTSRINSRKNWLSSASSFTIFNLLWNPLWILLCTRLDSLQQLKLKCESTDPQYCYTPWYAEAFDTISKHQLRIAWSSVASEIYPCIYQLWDLLENFNFGNAKTNSILRKTKLQSSLSHLPKSKILSKTIEVPNSVVNRHS